MYTKISSGVWTKAFGQSSDTVKKPKFIEKTQPKKQIFLNQYNLDIC